MYKIKDPPDLNLPLDMDIIRTHTKTWIHFIAKLWKKPYYQGLEEPRADLGLEIKISYFNLESVLLY